MKPLRVASLVAVLAIVGAAWFFLAPREIGGRASYAVIYGTSMEPRLHRGDLVILRSRPSYDVGDVVGYHSNAIHRNVLHRIIARHGDRFVFKGDNNDFVDPEQPAASQLFGRRWLVVPNAGSVLEKVHSPRWAAGLAGLAVLVLVGVGPAGGVRRRRRQPPTAAPERAAVRGAPPPPVRRGRSPRRVAATVIGAVGAVAVALGGGLAVAAYRQPVEKTVQQPDLTVQHGRFSLYAPAPHGAVYERDAVAARDPVFLLVVHRVQARFDYRVGSAYPAALDGSGTFDAVISDGNGWQRRIHLSARRRVHDGRLALRGMLDLKEVWRTISRFERETGVHNTSYHLALAPVIRVHGTAAGKPVRIGFAPRLEFDLDALRLQLAHPPGAVGSNALTRSASSAGSRTEPSSLHLPGHTLRVSTLRPIGLLVLGAGAVLLALAAGLALGSGNGDEAEEIEQRYGDLIVDVAARQRLSSDRRVASFAALVRIAERYDRLILHEARGPGHSYLVEDAGAVFRYDVGTVDEDTLELAPDTPRPPARLRSVRR